MGSVAETRWPSTSANRLRVDVGVRSSAVSFAAAAGAAVSREPRRAGSRRVVPGAGELEKDTGVRG